MAGISNDFLYWVSMMRLVQLCLGVIGIPFLIVGVSYIVDNDKTLPVSSDEQACVYEIVQSGDNILSRKWVGSYRKDGIRISAYHVVQDCASNCWLDTQTWDKSKKMLLLQAIRRIGTSDIALFQIPWNYTCVTTDTQSSVLSIVSGKLAHFPVTISGTTINLETSYGQSGSPVYQDGRLVGVVSQRAQWYSLIEILP